MIEAALIQIDKVLLNPVQTLTINEKAPQSLEIFKPTI